MRRYEHTATWYVLHSNRKTIQLVTWMWRQFKSWRLGSSEIPHKAIQLFTQLWRQFEVICIYEDRKTVELDLEIWRQSNWYVLHILHRPFWSRNDVDAPFLEEKCFILLVLYRAMILYNYRLSFSVAIPPPQWVVGWMGYSNTIKESTEKDDWQLSDNIMTLYTYALNYSYALDIIL